MGTSGADTLTGSSAAETLVGGDGDDILIGNGGADVLYGGGGSDAIHVNASNISALTTGVSGGNLARVDGGNGIDTLVIDGSGVTLDFTAIANQAATIMHGGSRIDSIERIDLTGSGNNQIKISIADVLDMSEMNVFNNGNGWTGLGATVQRTQMVIDGDAGDVVDVVGAWTNTGLTVNNSGHTYAIWTAAGTNGAQLLIDTHISVI